MQKEAEAEAANVGTITMNLGDPHVDEASM
jgi:hypothetical protein